MFGSATPTNRVKAPAKRKKAGTSQANVVMTDKLIKQPVIYRIFEDAAEYVDDSHWRDRLLAAARGSFCAKTVSFDGHYLRKDIKKRDDISVEITLDDPAEAAEEFINFHREYVNIHSNADLDKLRDVGANSRASCATLTWPNACTRTRNALFAEYVDRMAIEHDLDPDAAERLLRDLMLLNTTGAIDTKKVEIDENAIANIVCIEYSRGKYSFTDNVLAEWNKKLNADKTKQRKDRPGLITATYIANTQPPKKAKGAELQQ